MSLLKTWWLFGQALVQKLTAFVSQQFTTAKAGHWAVTNHDRRTTGLCLPFVITYLLSEYISVKGNMKEMIRT